MQSRTTVSWMSRTPDRSIMLPWSPRIARIHPFQSPQSCLSLSDAYFAPHVAYSSLPSRSPSAFDEAAEFRMKERKFEADPHQQAACRVGKQKYETKYACCLFSYAGRPFSLMIDSGIALNQSESAHESCCLCSRQDLSPHKYWLLAPFIVPSFASFIWRYQHRFVRFKFLLHSQPYPFHHARVDSFLSSSATSSYPRISPSDVVE